MPLIETIQPSEATGELAKLYKIIEAMPGTVGNNVQLLASAPSCYVSSLISSNII